MRVIAVVVVGGTLITGGRGTYLGMVGGVLLLLVCLGVGWLLRRVAQGETVGTTTGGGSVSPSAASLCSGVSMISSLIGLYALSPDTRPRSSRLANPAAFRYPRANAIKECPE